MCHNETECIKYAWKGIDACYKLIKSHNSLKSFSNGVKYLRVFKITGRFGYYDLAIRIAT